MITIVMNTQRTTTAIERIHICPGFNQQTSNFHCDFRAVLPARGDIEQRLLSIAAGAVRHLDADASLQRHTHSLYIAFANKIQQGDTPHHGFARKLLRTFGCRFQHAILLQVLHQVIAIPFPVQLPRSHARCQIPVTKLQKQQTQFMIVILTPQLAERRNSHHAVTAPCGHWGIRVCAFFQQDTSHTQPGRG